MGKIKKHEGKKILNDSLFYGNKVFGKIKEIASVEKTKILIDTDDKLSDNIALGNVVILMKYVIKDDGNFYPQLFFEEALLET